MGSTGISSAQVAFGGGGGGGSGAGANNDVRWTRYAGNGVATSQDDEFRDASIDGKWLRVDNAGHAGYVTWTEGADSLSAVVGNTADAAGELHAYVQAYALAVGESITCHLSMGGTGTLFPMGGLVVANGNTYGAGLQVVFVMDDFQGAAPGFDIDQWTGYNTRSATTGFGTPVIPCHMKIMRDAADVWRCSTSTNGFQWVEIGTTTLALTPTHVGIVATSWTSAVLHQASFDYFRRV